MSGYRRLTPGDPLDRWVMATPEERHYPGVARPMPDTVTYRFKVGLTDTDVGHLPCREAWLAEAARPLPFPDPFVPTQVLRAGADGALDFATFRHRPTLVSRAFRCGLFATAPLRTQFELTTCGKVELWLDRKSMARFAPQSRNRPARTTVELAVPVGPATLTLVMEDLHERDTTCLVALRLLEGEGLSFGLSEVIDADAVDSVEAVLDGLAPAAPVFTDGRLRLDARVAAAAPVEVTVQRIDQGVRGANLDRREDTLGQTERLAIAKPGELALGVTDHPGGCVTLILCAVAGGLRIERRTGTTLLPPASPLTAADLAGRKRIVSGRIEAAGREEPSRALLILARGGDARQAEKIIAEALVSVEECHDCADFWMLPLLRIWRDHRDRLSPGLGQRLESALLGFRYWLDGPGDDAMWFWSENHVLCFHASQYLAGSLLPERIFVNTGRTGADLAGEAAARLRRWFAAVGKDGLGEFNSAAYYPIDLLALLTLHDMAPDGHVRTTAGSLMDEILAMTALHTCGGTPAGSAGRIYEKEIMAGPATELGSLVAVAWGGPFRTGFDRVTALFCLSDYAPPEGLHRLAAPPARTVVTARYTQGHTPLTRLGLWKCADAQLSTADGAAPGSKGTQPHVVDLQLAGHPLARLWVNHPGDGAAWGARRPSYWAGNHVLPRVQQSDDLAHLIYDIERPWTVMPFTHAFVPAFACDTLERDGPWLFARVGAGYAGLWCSRPLEVADSGAERGCAWRAVGLRTAWIVAAGSAATHGRFVDFCRRLRSGAPSFDADTLRLRHGIDPDRPVDIGFDRADGEPRLPGTPHLALDGGSLLPWRAAIRPESRR